MFGEETNATMSFVMPADMPTGQTPKPTDASVKIRELEPGRFAVMRYSGRRNHKNESKSLAALEVWMRAQGLGWQSSPVYGYFDPPWTLPVFRRNEVMLRVSNANQ
jgi:DNA gyrase inhibitor GyrI